jgi:N4-(beta-N-acetylglucosaminyl)-L-asparaginase
MANRRNFLNNSSCLSSFCIAIIQRHEKLKILQNPRKLTNQLYFNLNFGMQANVAAWDVLKNNGKALDAVEAGVKFRS